MALLEVPSGILRVSFSTPISRRTRRVRLRRTRSIGLIRVHLGHILAAVGLNVRQLGAWLLEIARVKTRITPFARLMADAAAV
jgi:transposase